MAQPQHQQPTFVTVPPLATYQSAPTPQPSPHSRTSHYKQVPGRITGYIQILCGLASITFGICVLLALFGVIHEPDMHFGHVIFGIICWPIWSGFMYLITGSLGAASKPGSKCLIVGYMVMSIISAIFAAGQLIWESIGAAVTKCDDYYYYPYECQKPMISYGMHVGAVLAALIELIAAITGSAFGCHGCCQGCCNTGQAQSTQVVLQHVQYPAHPSTTLSTDVSAVNPGTYSATPVLYPQVHGPCPQGPGQCPPAYSARHEYNPTAPDPNYMEKEWAQK